ncbi:hypothetical protein JXA47_06130 [Candidatus Sumerlaeota bacterium]|nr:hypothetical protein [Candidatus Sumerlaeota bacterium]
MNLSIRFSLVTGLLILSALTVSTALAEIPEITATIDGTVDVGYGAAIAVQNANTSFGDANSGILDTAGGELDALYAAHDATNLYILSTGNVEDNWNGYYIFIDNIAETGGESGTFSGISGGDGIFQSAGNGIGGMTFPSIMNVDLIVALKFGDSGGSDPLLLDYRLQVANLVTGTVALDSGSPDQVTDDAPTDTVMDDAYSGYTFALDQSNVLGVEGTGIGFPATGTDPASVTTGMEFAIPLADIPGTIDDSTVLYVFTAYVSADGNFFSNQTLPPVPTPQDHHGTDPDYTALGLTPTTLQFSPPTAVSEWSLYN